MYGIKTENLILQFDRFTLIMLNGGKIMAHEKRLVIEENEMNLKLVNDWL
jgi:hypothetical protein